MRAQKYRHRVTVQEQVETFDSDTETHTKTWATVELDSDTELADIPAQVLTGPGREPHADMAKWSETSARINLPWFPGLTQKMRIVWQGVPYDIQSIETDETDRMEYRLRVKGGVSDGS